ncbi:SRPBCC family protein [Streptomyces xiaopingdaonensis]|uniref:SRPBCC family protein n=1 Tax=Streptomyces xiaopingdaonensis TaxID=1565415 RepID=UPI00049440C1|nr:SRPBCC family protein [Streptomyces xiaopingdaonensis]
MTHASAESRHLSVRIARPVPEVYAYASDPANLPEWAHGLGETVERIDGEWVAHSPDLGRVVVVFAPRNEFGVLDHDVTLPSGATVHNPVRVLADGEGSEVVFTLRRAPGTGDDAFARDAAAVTADLTRLGTLLESGAR